MVTDRGFEVWFLVRMRNEGADFSPNESLFLVLPPSLPDNSRNDLDRVFHLTEKFRASLLLLLSFLFRCQCPGDPYRDLSWGLNRLDQALALQVLDVERFLSGEIRDGWAAQQGCLDSHRTPRSDENSRVVQETRRVDDMIDNSYPISKLLPKNWCLTSISCRNDDLCIQFPSQDFFSDRSDHWRTVTRFSLQVGGERFFSSRHDNRFVPFQRQLLQHCWIRLVSFQPSSSVQCFVWHNTIGPCSEGEPDISANYPRRTNISGERNTEPSHKPGMRRIIHGNMRNSKSKSDSGSLGRGE